MNTAQWDAEQPSYDEFHLSILENNTIRAEWKYLTETKSKEEEAATGEMDDNRYLIEDISIDVTNLRKGTLDEFPEYIRRLGRNLFLATFPGKVCDLFRRAFNLTHKNYTNNRRWLWVNIEVHQKSIAYRWPLEFLFYPDEGFYLASQKPDLTLSRRPMIERTMKDDDYKPKAPPLKVLLIISKPKTLGGVISTTVMEDIAKWCIEIAGEGEEGSSRRIAVKVLGMVGLAEQKQAFESGFELLEKSATWLNLNDLIDDVNWRPDVIHFIGHGSFDADNIEGSLSLETLSGEPNWCSTSEMCQLFQRYKPRLLVLQACESARSGTEPGFMSMADGLYKLGIPAVVAMQFTISNKHASLFAEGFYEALRKGRGIDEAVQEGRYKITTDAKWGKYFGSPVLFSYYPGRIIEKKRSPAASHREPAIAEKRPSPIRSGKRLTDQAHRKERTPLERATGNIESVKELLEDPSARNISRCTDRLDRAHNDLEKCEIADKENILEDLDLAIESLKDDDKTGEEKAKEAIGSLENVLDALPATHSDSLTAGPVKPITSKHTNDYAVPAWHRPQNIPLTTPKKETTLDARSNKPIRGIPGKEEDSNVG